MGEWTKEALRQRLCQASFAMDDVLLYLDTHPEDQEALSYYHYVVGLRDEAMDAWRASVRTADGRCRTEYRPLDVDNRKMAVGRGGVEYVEIREKTSVSCKNYSDES